MTKRIQRKQKGAAMTWFDVLLKHWSDLSGEMQKKVQEYYELHAVAGQFGSMVSSGTRGNYKRKHVNMAGGDNNRPM